MSHSSASTAALRRLTIAPEAGSTRTETAGLLTAVASALALPCVAALAGGDRVSFAGQCGHVFGQEGQLAGGKPLRGDRFAVGPGDDVARARSSPSTARPDRSAASRPC